MEDNNAAQAPNDKLQEAQTKIAKLVDGVLLFRIYRECVKQENGVSGEARLFSHAQLLLTDKRAKDGQATHNEVAAAQDKEVRALRKENLELRIKFADDARVAELRAAKAAAAAPEPAAEQSNGAAPEAGELADAPS